ncbi:ABC transporter permease [Streptomyces sp. NBC_00859]|uniref:ABC transporter permease n=1 Tax=Streptomyces sp. NBC_00859 TaxID=2903682 RepID=UPI00386FA6E8|nr:ABC transporter permease [Streptomyces sp. NBC_00859]
MSTDRPPPGPGISGIPANEPEGAVTLGAAAVELEPIVSASSRRRGVPRWLRRSTGPMLLLFLWQVFSATGVLRSDVLASPGTIARTAGGLIADGTLPSAMAVSVQRVGVGLVLGALAGAGLGLLSGLLRVGEDLIDSVVQMLRAVPFAGLIPLLIVWLGIGEAVKATLIAFAVAFPLYINTYAGIRGVDEQLIEAGATLGLNRWGLIRHVVLPGALPGALTGLRFALGSAWLALVFGETVNASDGIGFLMDQAREYYRTDVIVVCLIVYAFLGLAADAVVRTLERLLLQWRPTFTGK